MNQIVENNTPNRYQLLPVTNFRVAYPSCEAPRVAAYRPPPEAHDLFVLHHAVQGLLDRLVAAARAATGP